MFAVHPPAPGTRLARSPAVCRPTPSPGAQVHATGDRAFPGTSSQTQAMDCPPRITYLLLGLFQALSHRCVHRSSLIPLPSLLGVVGLRVFPSRPARLPLVEEHRRFRCECFDPFIFARARVWAGLWSSDHPFGAARMVYCAERHRPEHGFHRRKRQRERDSSRPIFGLYCVPALGFGITSSPRPYPLLRNSTARTGRCRQPLELRRRPNSAPPS